MTLDDFKASIMHSLDMNENSAERMIADLMA
jgi:hypothetical protein